MGSSRKFYTDQFKEEAIKLAKSVGIPRAAKELWVHPCNINRWRKCPQQGASGSTEITTLSDVEKENLRLKKELCYVYEVNSILKKSLGIFAKEKSPSQ